MGLSGFSWEYGLGEKYGVLKLVRRIKRTFE